MLHTINKLDNLMNLKQAKFQAQLSKVQAQKKELEQRIVELDKNLALCYEERALFRKTAYTETFKSKMSQIDIDSFNFKLTSFTTQANKTIEQQQELTAEKDALVEEITKLQQTIKFYIIKQEKYRYLINKEI